MTLALIRIASLMLLGLFARGQAGAPQSKAFPLANNQTREDLQAMQTVIRTMSGIRQIEIDTSNLTINANGTADQLALTQWLVNELDRPAAPPPPPDSPAARYILPDSPGSQVRIFRLRYADTQRDLQEVMTLIRTMADIRQIFPYQLQHALCMRGTDAEMLLAEWLVQALDLPPGDSSPQPAQRDFPLPGGAEVARVIYLSRAEGSPELTAAFTAVRSATTARRIFYSTAQKALAIRGTPEQLAAAAAALR